MYVKAQWELLCERINQEHGDSFMKWYEDILESADSNCKLIDEIDLCNSSIVRNWSDTEGHAKVLIPALFEIANFSRKAIEPVCGGRV